MLLLQRHDFAPRGRGIHGSLDASPVCPTQGSRLAPSSWFFHLCRQVLLPLPGPEVFFCFSLQCILSVCFVFLLDLLLELLPVLGWVLLRRFLFSNHGASSALRAQWIPSGCLLLSSTSELCFLDSESFCWLLLCSWLCQRQRMPLKSWVQCK